MTDNVFSEDEWYDMVDDQERDKRVADEERARKEARVNRLADKVNRGRQQRGPSAVSDGPEKDGGHDVPEGTRKDKSKDGAEKDKRKSQTPAADKRKQRSSKPSVASSKAKQSKRQRVSSVRAMVSGAVVKPTSQVFPRGEWPTGWTYQQVDALNVDQFLKMREIKAKETTKSRDVKELPGFKPSSDRVQRIPITEIPGGMDDATTVFCRGRWTRLPIKMTAAIWANIPVEWPEKVPEWGANERGMQNRIPRETWVSRSDELMHNF